MRISVVKAIFLKDLSRWRLWVLGVCALSIARVALNVYVAQTGDYIPGNPFLFGSRGNLFAMFTGVADLLVAATCMFVIWQSVREDSPCRVTATLRTRPVLPSEVLTAKLLFTAILWVVVPLVTRSFLCVVTWGFGWDAYAMGYGWIVLREVSQGCWGLQFLVLLCLLSDGWSTNFVQKVLSAILLVVVVGVSLLVIAGGQSGPGGEPRSLELSREILSLSFLISMLLGLMIDVYRDGNLFRLRRNLAIVTVIASGIAGWWPYAFISQETLPDLGDLSGQFRVSIDGTSVKATAVDKRDEEGKNESLVALQWGEHYQGLPPGVFVTPYERYYSQFASNGGLISQSPGLDMYSRRVEANGIGMLAALEAIVHEPIVQELSEASFAGRVGLFPEATYNQVSGSAIKYSGVPVYAAYRWRETFSLPLTPRALSTTGLDQFRVRAVDQEGTKHRIDLRYVWLETLMWSKNVTVNRHVWWDRWNVKTELHQPASAHLLVHRSTNRAILLNPEVSAESNGECEPNTIGPQRICDYAVEVPSEVTLKDGMKLVISADWLAGAQLVRFDPQPIGWIRGSLKDVEVRLPPPVAG